MAITTIGSVKTATSSAAQLSVTLDASPAVLPGDLIVWACGVTGTNPAAAAPTDWRELIRRVNTNDTQAVGIFAVAAVGGEEGDTITSVGVPTGFAAVQVFRPTAGYKLDAYGIPTGYTASDAGTSATFTLTSSTTTSTNALGIFAARSSTGMNSGADSVSWDGEPDDANGWVYDTGAAKFDYKIYSAADTPDVVVKNLGTANKAVVLAVAQEIPTGTVIPFL